MHSLKEKFKYFMKVQGELYDIIEDAMNLDIETIVQMMNKHLASYNSKNNLYRFKLIMITEMNTDYKFIMSEKKSYLYKAVYQDTIHLKEIIRNSKLDELLGY